jgi:hypothetical protein
VAALALVLLLCDIATRKALWPHLVPRAAWSGVRAAPARVIGAGRVLMMRLRRLRPGRQAEQTAVPEAEPQQEEAEPEEEPAPARESVFERAKRRSRD